MYTEVMWNWTIWNGGKCCCEKSCGETCHREKWLLGRNVCLIYEARLIECVIITVTSSLLKDRKSDVIIVGKTLLLHLKSCTKLRFISDYTDMPLKFMITPLLQNLLLFCLVIRNIKWYDCTPFTKTFNWTMNICTCSNLKSCLWYISPRESFVCIFMGNPSILHS